MYNIVTFLNSAGRVFADFSLAMLIQSGVLILLLLMLDVVLRRRVRAVIRYGIWMLVLVKLVLPTTFSLPTGLGYWFAGKLPEVTAVNAPAVQTPQPVSLQPVVETPQHQPIQPVPAKTAVPAAATAPTMPKLPPITMTWQACVLLIWMTAVAVMLLLLVQRMFFVRSLVAQSSPADGAMLDILRQCRNRMAVRNNVAMRLSPLSASPSVCGLFRPTILMPESLAGRLSPEQLRSIFLHELAHIRRGDLWVSLTQTLLQIVYIYNPLLWLANAVIRSVREQAVDEMVLAALGDQAEDYPETLLNISRLTLTQPALSLRLVGVVESRKALAGRIRHILSRPFPKSAKLGFAGLIVILISAAILLPMARTADQKVRDISDILNVTDKLGQLHIQSISMSVLTGSTAYLDMAVKVENRSDSAMYLGLEYYLDLGKYNAFFSPGAAILATIREIPPGFKGDVQYPVLNRRPAKNAYMCVQLAKCPTKTSLRTERNIQFLSPDCEIIWDKKYYVTGSQEQTADSNKPQSATEKNQSDSSTKSTATLPNGVTVELVGICEHPSKGKQWWRPDGIPVNQSYVISVSFKSLPDSNNIIREFVYKVTGPQGLTTGPIPDSNYRELKTGMVLKGKGGSYSPDLYMFCAALLKDAQTVTVKIAAAADSWTTNASNDPVTGTTTFGPNCENSICVFSKGFATDKGNAAVTISHNAADKEVRVIAVDADGKEYVPSYAENTKLSSVIQSSSYFDGIPNSNIARIPLKKVKRFEFQTRPYQWVIFKNVSLKPNLKTDVQIEVEKSAVPVKDTWSQPVEQSESHEQKQRISRIIGADLPNTVREVKFAAGPSGDIAMARFDIPTSDLKALLAQSKRLPQFHNLKPDSRIKETLENSSGPKTPWWKPSELKDAVYGRWQYYQGDSTSMMYGCFLAGAAEIDRDLMRVYLKAYSDLSTMGIVKSETGGGLFGLSCSLQADRKTWTTNEIPILKATIVNTGNKSLGDKTFMVVPSAQGFVLKVGNKGDFNRVDSEVVKEIEIKPHQHPECIEIPLDQQWIERASYPDRRLNLSPGGYTIKVAVKAARQEDTNRLINYDVFSNPVEIEILPEKTPAVQAEGTEK
jgi:beta-lactamase regulating signal transducer with metallopeptidase domain